MKILKFTVLILTILIINSCNKEDEIEIPPYVLADVREWPNGGLICPQELLLSFQNKSGRDLVKGIGFWASYDINDISLSEGVRTGGNKDALGRVKRELYTLEDVYEDVYKSRQGYSPIGIRKGKPFSKKYTELNGNYDYLYFQTDGLGSRLEKGFYEKVTFKLVCPYIFGDNKVRDIDTWWKPDKAVGAFCYRIEFGGKEIIEMTYLRDVGEYVLGQPYSVATVVLDK